MNHEQRSSLWRRLAESISDGVVIDVDALRRLRDAGGVYPADLDCLDEIQLLSMWHRLRSSPRLEWDEYAAAVIYA